MYALVNTKQGHCVAEWRSHGCEDKQSCASFSLGLARLALKVALLKGMLEKLKAVLKACSVSQCLLPAAHPLPCPLPAAVTPILAWPPPEAQAKKLAAHILSFHLRASKGGVFLANRSNQAASAQALTCGSSQIKGHAGVLGRTLVVITGITRICVAVSVYLWDYSLHRHMTAAWRGSPAFSCIHCALQAQRSPWTWQRTFCLWVCTAFGTQPKWKGTGSSFGWTSLDSLHMRSSLCLGAVSQGQGEAVTLQPSLALLSTVAELETKRLRLKNAFSHCWAIW